MTNTIRGGWKGWGLFPEGRQRPEMRGTIIQQILRLGVIIHRDEFLIVGIYRQKTEQWLALIGRYETKKKKLIRRGEIDLYSKIDLKRVNTQFFILQLEG